MSETLGMGMGGCEVVPTPAPVTRVEPQPPWPAPIQRSEFGERARGTLAAAVPTVALVLLGGNTPHAAAALTSAVLLAAGVVVSVRTSRGERPLPVPSVSLPVLALAAIPALQLLRWPTWLADAIAPGLARWAETVNGPLPSALTLYPDATVTALMGWLGYGAWLVVALTLTSSEAARRAALASLGVVGVAEAAFGVGNLWTGNLSVLGQPRVAYLGDATGTLLDPHHFASVLILSGSALLAWSFLAAERRHRRRRQVLLLSVVTLLCIALLASHSTVGFLAAVSAGTLAALLSFPRDSDRRAARRIALALGVGLIAIRAAAGLDLASEDPTAQQPITRGALWSEALTVARDFPLLGAGAGTFAHVLPAYRTIPGPAVLDHARHDYLELATEGGALALGIVLVAVMVFGRRTGRALGRLRTRSEHALIALMCGSAGVLLQGALDDPLHSFAVALLCILVGACALNLAAEAE